MSFILNKILKKIKKIVRFLSDREAGIPIVIIDFRSEIQSSDHPLFLTFNYKKVPIKIKVLQLNP